MPVSKPLRWEDPPDRGDSTFTDWYAIGVALMKKPGRYAHVATYPTTSTASTHAYQIRMGRKASLTRAGRGLGGRRLGTFDATVRRIGEETRVYAKFVKEDS